MHADGRRRLWRHHHHDNNNNNNRPHLRASSSLEGEHRDDDLPTGVDDVRCIHGRDLRIITLTNASSLVDTLTNLTKLAAISGSLLMDISDGSGANLSDVHDRPRVAGGTEESCGFG